MQELATREGYPCVSTLGSAGAIMHKEEFALSEGSRLHDLGRQKPRGLTRLSPHVYELAVVHTRGCVTAPGQRVRTRSAVHLLGFGDMGHVAISVSCRSRQYKYKYKYKYCSIAAITVNPLLYSDGFQGTPGLARS